VNIKQTEIDNLKTELVKIEKQMSEYLIESRG